MTFAEDFPNGRSRQAGGARLLFSRPTTRRADTPVGATVIGTPASCITEWISLRLAPHSTLEMSMAMGISLSPPDGLLGGWLGSRAVLDNRVVKADPVDDKVS